MELSLGLGPQLSLKQRLPGGSIELHPLLAYSDEELKALLTHLRQQPLAAGTRETRLRTLLRVLRASGLSTKEEPRTPRTSAPRGTPPSKNFAKWLEKTVFWIREKRAQMTAHAASVQEKYLATRNPKDLVPLTQADLAKQVGIHHSTASRLIHPSLRVGSVPLRDLIQRPFGQGVSSASMRATVEETIRANPKLTDAAISNLLSEKHGFVVARRTVAKYRADANLARRATTRLGYRSGLPAAVLDDFFSMLEKNPKLKLPAAARELEERHGAPIYPWSRLSRPRHVWRERFLQPRLQPQLEQILSHATRAMNLPELRTALQILHGVEVSKKDIARTLKKVRRPELAAKVSPSLKREG